LVSKRPQSVLTSPAVLRLRAWLVEPSPAVRDPEQRRKARLLSIFILCLFLLFLFINGAYALTIPGYRVPAADLLGYVLLTVLYILSRTRWQRVAVAILFIMFPLNVFLNVLQGTSLNIPATLSFLIPSYVLAGIMLSLRGTALYGFGVNLCMLLLPLVAPERVSSFQEILGPLGAGVVVVSLTIIGMLSRDQIERDRQGDLRRAYDSTLEGWSRAVELRDKVTEGHSRRVTDVALRLARLCGLRGEQLDSIHRGALLHDIGKMGIPDAILTKPGRLTDEEMAIMRTHPRVAVGMLSAIDFLRPALDIPAYHHEWWDGSGYPDGLRGEAIPLAARIFAVVDAWDALLSDRPYRKAWTRQRVIEHLKQQSGIQFDPLMVKRFLSLDP
jgi:putative nucleotidyltransferase with HDIG domain